MSRQQQTEDPHAPSARCLSLTSSQVVASNLRTEATSCQTRVRYGMTLRRQRAAGGRFSARLHTSKKKRKRPNVTKSMIKDHIYDQRPNIQSKIKDRGMEGNCIRRTMTLLLGALLFMGHRGTSELVWTGLVHMSHTSPTSTRSRCGPPPLWRTSKPTTSIVASSPAFIRSFIHSPAQMTSRIGSRTMAADGGRCGDSERPPRQVQRAICRDSVRYLHTWSDILE